MGRSYGTQSGLLAALVADAAPANRRGTAFGLFNLVGGAVLLAFERFGRLLWNRFGASATFYAGALAAGLALMGLLFQIRKGNGPPLGDSYLRQVDRR